MSRMVAAGTNAYFIQDAVDPGLWWLQVIDSAGRPISGDLTIDWVPLAHTILAEAEIAQRERDGDL